MLRISLVISSVLAAMPCMGQSVQFIQVTEGEGDHRYPVWSPTEGYLALESTRDGNWEIYVIRLDDRSIARFTSDDADDRYPAWDIDSRRILFQSNRTGEPELHFIDLKNYTTTLLGHIPGVESYPDWSSDGRQIAASVVTDSVSQIVIFESDGTSRTIAPSPFPSVWPRWSPDNTEIAFHSRRDTKGTDDEIYVYNIIDSTLRRLTNRLGHDFCPTWSPDGDRIAAVGIDPDGTLTLRLIPVNDDAPVAVLRTSFYRMTEPDWSPDGRFIAVAAKQKSTDPFHIYVVAVGE